ncbi:MAG: hemolysin family protein [Gemmatimonadaceae bacterium]
MTAVAALLAALAAAGAALCALADGALLSIDDDAPPASLTVAAIVARREPAHRALAFGRIMALLLAGALTAGAIVSSTLPANDIAPVVLLAGVVIVVLAESSARIAGDSLGAPAVASLGPFIAAVEWVMRPVVAFGSWSDALLNHLLPASAPDSEDREATLEQFREVVEAEADVTRDEAVLLRGVFSLGHTAVQDIMVPRVDIIGIDRNTAWSEVIDRVRSAQHARLVVFDGTLDEVVGVLYAKDLLAPVIADAEPTAGWLSLVRPATFIPAAKHVDRQLREFKASHRHIAIVVDEYGGTAGLVTLEDALELIVGEIRDENDVEAPDVEREDDDKFWVSARVTLDELSELTGQDFTHEDVQTVGGLVYELVGSVPRAGESLTVGNFKLVVERVVRRRVERVYLERVHPAAEDAA